MEPTQDDLKQLALARVDQLFQYYPPKGDQVERYAKLNEAFKQLATLVVELTPYSREQTIVIGELWKIRMLANGTIAVNE